jgi:hypothetical protein
MRTGSSMVALGAICLDKAPQAFAQAVVDVNGY